MLKGWFLTGKKKLDTSLKCDIFIFSQYFAIALGFLMVYPVKSMIVNNNYCSVKNKFAYLLDILNYEPTSYNSLYILGQNSKVLKLAPRGVVSAGHGSCRIKKEEKMY